ncbi:MAG TPA: hypothetical protein VN903_13820, partial [Polyangia bacterium]|nr:hypothetical protein [Polyangia bacterium]
MRWHLVSGVGRLAAVLLVVSCSGSSRTAPSDGAAGGGAGASGAAGGGGPGAGGATASGGRGGGGTTGAAGNGPTGSGGSASFPCGAPGQFCCALNSCADGGCCT